MDKQTAIGRAERGFDEILAAIKGMNDAQMTRTFYGEWSVKDILAHLAGWQHTMCGAMERLARGEKPTPEGVDYSDADRWNAGFAAAMRPQSPETVVADLRQSFANYVRAARAVSADRYGEGKTINRLLEASSYGHYEEHLPALREYRASLGLA